jgi:hypothetical protein
VRWNRSSPLEQRMQTESLEPTEATAADEFATNAMMRVAPRFADGDRNIFLPQPDPECQTC